LIFTKRSQFRKNLTRGRANRAGKRVPIWGFINPTIEKIQDQTASTTLSKHSNDGRFRSLKILLIYLHKILPIFLLPIGLAILLLALGLVLSRKKPVIAALILIWLSSAPLISDALMIWVESPYQRLPALDVPKTDAIVVLSGGRVVAPGPQGTSEWRDPDRFFAGIELFKAGQAPWLVFTGGGVPWEPEAKPEGVVLQAHAQAWGVPSTAILVSDEAQNTAQEAVAVKAVLELKFQKPQPIHITLVTSAFHMQRAKKLFESAGFDVVAYPVDFQVSVAQRFSVIDLLPQAQAINKPRWPCANSTVGLFMRSLGIERSPHLIKAH
jgi:uncharacterized SAM-binding protein YcdF (DUF218 family)